jgi:hypothetical protein
MTDLLERALAEVAKLSVEEQDSIAAVILELLKYEQRWNSAFTESQDQLSQLADQVRGDIQAGRTERVTSDGL